MEVAVMIPIYNVRMSLLDTSKGVTNKMIQDCMKAEIMDLRKALRAAEKKQAKALAAHDRAAHRQIKKLTAERDESKARANAWRSYATRYQKQLAAQR
jgi:uncharacterized coiled-coil DUF342 family protein